MVYEELTEEQCLNRLAQSRVGRVAISMQALPVVLPVNYGVVNGGIVFCTIRGSRLSDALAGAVVAFEIDGYDAIAHNGWSVLVQGVAEMVTDPAVIAVVSAMGLEPWAPGTGSRRYVRIAPTVISGRHIRHGEPAAAAI